MRNKLLSVAMFVCITLISGCTTEPLTPNEFWYKQGKRVGETGLQEYEQMIAHFKKKVDFQPDAFQKGYQEGMMTFCDPFRARNKGLSGRKYEGQCDEHPNADLIKVDWDRGWQQYIGGGERL